MRLPLKFRHWALVLGYWILALGALAQPAQPPKLRFLFLDETAGAYFIKTGAAYRQISSAPYAISSEFTPTNLGNIEIYKTDPAASTPAETVRIKIASVPLPAETTAALFIITPQPQVPGSTTPTPYSVEMIKNDAGSAPLGSLRILNRGQVTMAALIGSDTITAKPGETQVFKPATDSRHRVRIKVAAPDPDGWKLLDDRIVKVRAESRMTGIFIFSPSGMRHTYPEDELIARGPPPPGHFWLTYTDTP